MKFFLRKKSALNTLIWLIWLARFRKTTVCILVYQLSQDGWIEAKEYNFAQDLLPLWVASIKILNLRIWFDEAFALKELPPIAWKILLLWWFLRSFFDWYFDDCWFPWSFDLWLWRILRNLIALWLLIFVIYSLCFHHPPRAYPSLWYHCCQT